MPLLFVDSDAGRSVSVSDFKPDRVAQSVACPTEESEEPVFIPVEMDHEIFSTVIHPTPTSRPVH